MEAFAYTDINAPLVERCRLGDRRAQAEIYKRYSKAMFNASLRITGDFAEAEDVLQEAFLSAFRELHSYKGDSSFGSWLKRIVINKSINCLRNRRLQVVPLGEQHDAAGSDADSHFSEADAQELHWRADVVRRCVQELPDGYRVVLSLYLLEGYDHAEIAGILDITESTSKSQYSRARKKLLELARQHGL
ncbi:MULTISPECIES: RNA polymerase sigma factor [Hymenobacter]|uniref:RNA polymerase sigma factor n=2 Tax=Hymenobacter TaxID=89966 RepID=A0ABS6WV53_9BACT|nr:MULTISPECIES: RNA polymerase sigma factor [Hymenobacter]MBO3272922.1 RNA polymerase sigma factor [Hymenobacter defluvii]MBW3127482.1 RNA polymerase sigma factor [Hymenobacter profundi]QNE40646.1 RNA polymerase sigma factor [Hymenobacter sp. NBH84]